MNRTAPWPHPKAFILDRDGTLISHVPYLHDPDKIVLLPGVRDGLLQAVSAGVKLFLHTNQSGVGRGYFTLEAVHACNRRLVELLDIGPAPFARICIASEAPDQSSRHRKPSPVFAEEVTREFGFRREELWYLGDRGSDLKTAHAAGTNGAGIATGLDDLTAELAEAGLAGAYPIFSRFDLAVKHILGTS